MVIISRLGPPEKGIHLTQENTWAYMEGKPAIGRGTLYVSEERLTWVADSKKLQFSLNYAHIAVHAISRDHETFPSDCLYLMLDIRLVDKGESGFEASSDDSDDSNSSGPNVTEFRFVPEQKDKLADMFKALSDCSALHPDPEMSSDSEKEEDDNDEEDENGDEEGDVGEAGDGKGNGQEEEGMFDDADDEPMDH